MPVVSICLSPGLQRTVVIDSLALGEVNRLKSVLVDIAGKGVNVCRVLQRLGVDSICLAQGGNNASEITTRADKEGLNLQLIPSSGQLRTCTTILEMPAAGERRVTELVEPTSPVDAACVSALTDTLKTLLPTAKALVIAGSMAPGFPSDYQAGLAELAHAVGVPVLIDLHGPALRATIAARPSIVKINLAEFVSTFIPDRFVSAEHGGVLAQDVLPSDVLTAVADVSREHATSFVLTRGARSVLLARNGDVRVVPVTPLAAHETLNTIGSGDSFLAGMLTTLLEEETNGDWSAIPLAALEKAIHFATACAQSNARTWRPGFLEDSFVRC